MKAAYPAYRSTSGWDVQLQGYIDQQVIDISKAAGVVGDGVTDDTAAIQAAITAAPSGSRVIFGQGTTYLLKGITVNNKSNFRIDATGATFSLVTPQTTRMGCFWLTGTCEHVTIEGARIIGSGVITDQQAGIVLASGGVYSDITIRNNYVYNVTLGISLNADGSGSIAGVLVEGNVVDTVVGTASGYGYGIHHASSGLNPTGVAIVNNVIRHAQRHSIYQGKGRGIVISGNRIYDHRDQNKDSSSLSAIMTARSGDVTITGNVVLRPACGGINVGGQGVGDLIGPFVISGNIVAEPQDSASLLILGNLAPTAADGGTAENVIIIGNTFKSSTPARLVQLYNGLSIRFSNNLFSTPYTTTQQSVIAIGGNGVTGNDFMDNLHFNDNLFDIGTGNIAIYIASGAEVLTSKMVFNGNRRVIENGPKTFFGMAAASTNPNVQIINQPVSGFSFVAGTALLSPALNGPESAGGALSAATGYVTVNINGTDRKIPYV